MYGNWTVTKEANCSQNGEETRTCSVCDAEEHREITNPIGHKFDESGVCEHCHKSFREARLFETSDGSKLEYNAENGRYTVSSDGEDTAQISVSRDIINCYRKNGYTLIKFRVSQSVSAWQQIQVLDGINGWLKWVLESHLSGTVVNLSIDLNDERIASSEKNLVILIDKLKESTAYIDEFRFEHAPDYKYKDTYITSPTANVVYNESGDSYSISSTENGARICVAKEVVEYYKSAGKTIFEFTVSQSENSFQNVQILNGMSGWLQWVLVPNISGDTIEFSVDLEDPRLTDWTNGLVLYSDHLDKSTLMISGVSFKNSAQIVESDCISTSMFSHEYNADKKIYKISAAQAGTGRIMFKKKFLDNSTAAGKKILSFTVTPEYIGSAEDNSTETDVSIEVYNGFRNALSWVLTANLAGKSTKFNIDLTDVRLTDWADGLVLYVTKLEKNNLYISDVALATEDPAPEKSASYEMNVVNTDYDPFWFGITSNWKRDSL